jgi:hypothetical protein
VTRNELIERAITALVSVDSDSDIAKPMRLAIAAAERGETR